MCDYYLQTWYVRVASRVAKQLKTWDLRKVGNINLVPSLRAKMKVLLILENS